MLCFEAAMGNNLSVGDAVSKVQKDVLSKCDEVFKGKRYKGFIKFDYDTNCISIQVYQIQFFSYFDRDQNLIIYILGLFKTINILFTECCFFKRKNNLFICRSISLPEETLNFRQESEQRSQFALIRLWEEWHPKMQHSSIPNNILSTIQ